jgi:hypothetical protein
MLAAVLGALGWPADRLPALTLAVGAVGATAAGWAIGHNVDRWVRAQEDGVFRVRTVHE